MLYSLQEWRLFNMAKNYSEKIKSAIENYLIEDEWKYQFVSENGFFKAGIKLECKLKSAEMFINVTEQSFCVTTVLPVGADDESKPAVAEFITRANYGHVHGCFEMDYTDGEIRFRSDLYCGDAVPTHNQIEHIIYLNGFMVNRYGDALTKVLYGLSSAQDAIDEVENN